MAISLIFTDPPRPNPTSTQPPQPAKHVQCSEDPGCDGSAWITAACGAKPCRTHLTRHAWCTTGNCQARSSVTINVADPT